MFRPQRQCRSPAAPGTPGNRGHFLLPADGQTVPANGIQQIRWEAPADTPPTATISLYYQRTEVISGNLHIDVPIVNNGPFSAGQYEWDTGKLLNGSYHVRAVVDDGVNELSAVQISQPDDTCVALPSGLYRVRSPGHAGDDGGV